MFQRYHGETGIGGGINNDTVTITVERIFHLSGNQPKIDNLKTSIKFDKKKIRKQKKTKHTHIIVWN